MNWQTIFALGSATAEGMVAIVSAPSFWGAFIPTSILIVVLWRKARRSSATLSVPGFGSVTFDLTDGNREFAWQLHVQLATRKAALPFDESGDVIADVFASLFELFTATREMLLAFPPVDGRERSNVASLAMRVLNDAIRPRLTRWHAEYRRWWEQALALPANVSRSPQNIQRDFRQYAELVADIQNMNTELSQFADALAAVLAGKRTRTWWRRLRPTAPTATPAVAQPEVIALPPTTPPRVP